MFTMRPVGYVRSGYDDKTQIPKGPDAKHEAEGLLEILPELERGLMDVEGFSHLFVIWAFDRAEPGDVLEATPPTDDRTACSRPARRNAPIRSASPSPSCSAARATACAFAASTCSTERPSSTSSRT